MIEYDSHVHTAFSTDSDTPMEQMVVRGIECGLRGITFTDHMDYHFPAEYNWDSPDNSPPFTFSTEKYFCEIKRLRNIYGDRIQLYCGVEIGLKEDAKEDNIRLSRRSAFDYIIGSIHLVDDMDPYFPQFWEAFEERVGLEKYFEATLKNLSDTEIHLDTLGHLDYIVRYSPSGYRLYSYRLFADLIDEILRCIIARDISLEINTSGYKNGGPMPNPSEDVVRRYRELGGERITFGSDAHDTGRLAARFSDAERLAKNAGFEYYVTFTQHKPTFHTL